MSSQRDQLICNARDCFKKIDDVAWITCCSHVFCAQHGKDAKLRQTGSASCPACGSRFRDDFGVVERNLNSSPQYRALLLCGYSPEVIMEIANNAITFWNFQKQQVCLNLERKLEYYRESVSRLKKEVAQEKSDAESKTNRLEKQLEQAQTRIKELSEENAITSREARGEHSRMDHQARKRKMDDFLL
ncbi:E3 ubiquitin-protein ligase CCNB1IP1-like [Topomyia yanbarensis]|uniref:E3 ubiquitin-protein ligase CCNB1IP1-like n=1 Tax=Topomyia yanbarensis TaxID=2498891 RepID=UPI00273B5463|nr:E3 ubiquitin-protein ligase CCNB1IP1-like [Topomyia yanbarensis]